MSQTSSEKFLYFTVGFLKGSAALEALRQDAMKYHMIDQPGQLIALRLTEYYEMTSQDSTQPVAGTPPVKLPPEAETTAGNQQIPPAETHQPQRSVPTSLPSPATALTNAQSQPAPAGQSPTRLPADTHALSESTSNLSQLSGKMRALRRDNESVVSVSSAAEQNADEAADYWSTL